MKGPWTRQHAALKSSDSVGQQARSHKAELHHNKIQFYLEEAWGGGLASSSDILFSLACK